MKNFQENIEISANVTIDGKESNQNQLNICSDFVAIPIAIGNGLLYGATIPEVGGHALTELFGIKGEEALWIVRGLGAGAGLVYTMFYYKTLKSLSLKPSTATQIFFSIYAPFAASAYLADGVQGAKMLGFLPNELVIAVGVTLFIFRMVSCVDTSVKLPERLNEMKELWDKAWENKNCAELVRLIVTGLSSMGYAISSTDSIYSAVNFILTQFNLNERTISIASYISSGIGALGILPLILYWTHRGLKQLTFGGEIDANGEIKDPTDRYTYLGFMFVLPNILGTLGATIGTSGNVFGKLGITASIIRIMSATVYGGTSGVPGMSSLLRSLFSKADKENFPPLLQAENSGVINEYESSEIKRKLDFQADILNKVGLFNNSTFVENEIEKKSTSCCLM